MTEIIATPYVPGFAQGPVSHDPEREGAITVISGSALPLDTRPAGVVVVDGAMFSHPMLELLAKGIPTVIMSAGQAAGLDEGQMVLLDGYKGSVTSLSAGISADANPPVAPKPGEAIMTADGVAVALRATVRSAAGAARAKNLGAQSIGLVRTEYLEPEAGRVPDSAFYRQVFGELFAAADPLDVTLRLIDIAADKFPAWISGTRRRGGALGEQGARLFLDEPLRSVVSAQLDGLARSTATQRVKLLVPYITTLEEMRQLKEWIGSRLDLPVGAMIETPAAALDIAGHLEIADFAALGTNDLMQCLFAADRDDPALQHYLDPYSPMLYRFLAQIAGEAGEKLPLLQVCGLLSHLPGVLPVMMGLGFRNFSVGAPYIPYLAMTVRETNTSEATALAEDVCRLKERSAVSALLRASACNLAGSGRVR
ncbi:MAG: putative PEP-binding protein [Sedimenticola sp.]